MQRSTSTSACEVAGSIDILSEILLRLPVKPLLRFKSVSKQWLTLISDPCFHCSHFLHHHTHTPTSLLLSDKCGPSPRFHILPLTKTPTLHLLNLDFLNRPNVTVLRSCNGLLICHSTPSTYFICNPTTRNFITLTFPDRKFRKQTRALYLAFDPLTSPHYQIISLRILGTQIFQVLCVFNVYSSKSRSWSHPGVSAVAPSKVITASGLPGVYCNRAIHWCNEGESSVYFDIDNQCLKSWSMPFSDSEWIKRCIEYFGESRGRLHLIVSVVKETLKFDLFETKDDYSVWSLIHHVDLNPMRVEFPEVRWDLANFVLPLYIVCPAKEEKSMLVLLVGGAALSFDPVDSTLRKLCVFNPGMTAVDVVTSYMLGEVFQYFENLSFVDAFTAYEFNHGQ